jgi:hypothetical protein
VTKTTSPKLSVKEVTSENGLIALLNDALSEPSAPKKGFKFESFFETFMDGQERFKFILKHPRSELGEIDYVYRNENYDNFWCRFSYVCVECKNWKDTITSTETDHLLSLIREKSPLSCLGVFITNTSFEQSAITSMKNARLQDGTLIVPIEGKLLERMVKIGFRNAVIEQCEKSVFKKRF